jgi:hypothetical protein
VAGNESRIAPKIHTGFGFEHPQRGERDCH